MYAACLPARRLHVGMYTEAWHEKVLCCAHLCSWPVSGAQGKLFLHLVSVSPAPQSVLAKLEYESR